MKRTYCQQCGTYRFKAAEELCFHCARGAKVERSGGADTPPEQHESDKNNVSPGTHCFGGVKVAAVGFSPEQFERALCRAMADNLVVSIDATGQHIVGPAGVNGGYAVTRERCTCKAGQVGTPCKHRAALIAHLDIREPALRRQWESAARTAVAA